MVGEQQPGPSEEKRRRTSKTFEGFVTKHVNTVSELSQDYSGSAVCDTRLCIRTITGLQWQCYL